jgi:hypothetical protein
MVDEPPMMYVCMCVPGCVCMVDEEGMIRFCMTASSQYHTVLQPLVPSFVFLS